MQVSCPDCNAEYKVNERSSLTKTVKFVCIECGNSWIDKFEKLGGQKEFEPFSGKSVSDNQTVPEKQGMGSIELNSLAFEEVKNSFGNHSSQSYQEHQKNESEHIFHFETSEPTLQTSEAGPSETFPKLRNNEESSKEDQIDQRDIKEIEIEKRLKESSELLKKAKQPQPDYKNKSKEQRPLKKRFFLILSILLVISFFVYNLSILFSDEVLEFMPFAPALLSELIYYRNIFLDTVFILIEKAMMIIPNLE